MSTEMRDALKVREATSDDRLHMRWGSGYTSLGCPSRAQDNLNAVVLFVPENLIAIGSLLLTQVMRNHKGRIDVALGDTREQWTQVFVHVRLAHFQGQTFGKRSPYRHFIE